MAPGWDFCSHVGDGSRGIKYNYCGKYITGGITRVLELWFVNGCGCCRGDHHY